MPDRLGVLYLQKSIIFVRWVHGVHNERCKKITYSEINLKVTFTDDRISNKVIILKHGGRLWILIRHYI